MLSYSNDTGGLIKVISMKSRMIGKHANSAASRIKRQLGLEHASVRKSAEAKVGHRHRGHELSGDAGRVVGPGVEIIEGTLVVGNEALTPVSLLNLDPVRGANGRGGRCQSV